MDGPVTVKIPPGSQPNSQLVMKGKGVKMVQNPNKRCPACVVYLVSLLTHCSIMQHLTDIVSYLLYPCYMLVPPYPISITLLEGEHPYSTVVYSTIPSHPTLCLTLSCTVEDAHPSDTLVRKLVWSIP